MEHHRALLGAGRGIANGGAPLSRLLTTAMHPPGFAGGDQSGELSRRQTSSFSPELDSRRSAIEPGFGGSGSGGEIVVNYSPNVTVNGAASADNIDHLLIDAMRRHGHELAQILRREAAVRRRTEF
jgi:hypothetical protein